MCLITKWKSPKIAEKDIVCYKFYIKRGSSFISPYRYVQAPDIGEKECTMLDENIESICSDIIINSGFHSFVYLSSLEFIKKWSPRTETYTIFKCIIPEGSKYYEGLFNSDSAYCSDSIILVEQIETILPNLIFE